LVVSIPIKYQSPSVEVEALRARLDFGRWQNLRGAILDELQEISVGDAQNWASHPEVRRYYPSGRHQELCNEIRVLYQTDRMRMEALAPGLLTALEKLAHGP
jgi:hypothetical protein